MMTLGEIFVRACDEKYKITELGEELPKKHIFKLTKIYTSHKNNGSIEGLVDNIYTYAKQKGIVSISFKGKDHVDGKLAVKILNRNKSLEHLMKAKILSAIHLVVK